MSRKKAGRKMKNKEINKAVSMLNSKILVASKISGKAMKKLKEYEPLAVVAIALLIMISGLSVSVIERSSANAPTGLVVIDSTSMINAQESNLAESEEGCAEEWFCTEWKECSKDGTTERECLDFNGCMTEISKPMENMECTPMLVAESLLIEEERDAAHSSITGFAVSYAEGIVSDSLLVLIYAIALLSLGIAGLYAYMAYVKRSALHHSIAASAYWLAMAGMPLSIYYATTRGNQPILAYIAFAISIAAFAAIMHLKPWEPRGLSEIQHVNRLLEMVSSRSNRRIMKIRNGRRERQKSFEFFREKLNEWRRENQLRMMGARDVKLEDVDRDIRKIMEKSPEIRKDILEIENNVKMREENFERMNKQLSRWAEERRHKRQKEEHMKRQDELEKQAKKAKEAPAKQGSKGSESK